MSNYSNYQQPPKNQDQRNLVEDDAPNHNDNDNHNNSKSTLSNVALLQPCSKIECEKTLDQVLVQPTFVSTDPTTVVDQILKEFNKNVNKSTPCFTTSNTRGYRIARNQFLLGHCNKTPELAKFSGGVKVARCLYLGINTTAEYISIVNITDSFYGAHGSYVLNVPQGQYAKAMSWNLPKLYAPGVHVIHDPSFSFAKDNGGFIEQNSNHIKHGNINVLYVPTGKVATVRIGSIAYILESRSTPYVFDHPLFSLVKKSADETFWDSTANCIINGSIKRVIIPTGNVVIAYNNGKLEILEPSSDSKPIIIDSETYEIKSFLDVTVQTLQFPSDETKKQRRKDLPNASAEEVSYEIFTTRDSLKVGVKLLVAYRISDPSRAVSVLGVKGIVPHIENLSNVDMSKAISMCSSQEFLNFYQTKPKKCDPVSRQIDQAYTGEPEEQKMMHFQDIVKEQLAIDLGEYGIELIRLNIETPKIMDTTIAHKMAEQSIRSAESNAQESILAQQANIAIATSNKEARVKEIEQEIINKNKITTAKADLEVAEQQAQKDARTKAIQQEQENRNRISAAAAELEAARNRAEAILIQAEAEKKSAQLRAEAWTSNPQLFDLEIKKLEADAIGKSNFLVAVQAQANNRLMYTPFDYFNGSNSMPNINTQKQIK